MHYEVVITPSGKADIFETNTWLLENYPNIADKWLWETSRAVTSLARLPERCAVSAESAVFDVEVRQLLYGKKPHVYRILFSIRETKVFVLRVRHTRQKSLLEDAED